MNITTRGSKNVKTRRNKITCALVNVVTKYNSLQVTTARNMNREREHFNETEVMVLYCHYFSAEKINVIPR